MTSVDIKFETGKTFDAFLICCSLKLGVWIGKRDDGRRSPSFSATLLPVKLGNMTKPIVLSSVIFLSLLSLLQPHIVRFRPKRRVKMTEQFFFPGNRCLFILGRSPPNPQERTLSKTRVFFITAKRGIFQGPANLCMFSWCQHWDEQKCSEMNS